MNITNNLHYILVYKAIVSALFKGVCSKHFITTLYNLMHKSDFRVIENIITVQPKF